MPRPSSGPPAKAPRSPRERRSLGLAVEDRPSSISVLGPSLGFMARILVQVTMPHSRPSSDQVERRNGHLRLHMLAPSTVGLPYGAYPRLLLAWLSTEAVRTRSKEIELGDSMGAFMRRLDIPVSHGVKGTARGLRDQMQRLFTCAVGWIEDDGRSWSNFGIRPVEKSELWWDPKQPDQTELWRSHIVLNETFFKELVDRPVPIDMRALRALSKSPLALDIYSWLTYRMSYLEQDQLVPWELLELQFGADYTRPRAFKAAFVKRLKSVLEVYPTARVSPDAEGLILSPSPTHVPRLHRA